MGFQMNFHQSFAPETEALAQLLRVASENPGYLTKEEISEITMIPTGERSGKVVPHILYAQAMGLLYVEKKVGKFSLTLTKVGEVISEEDPYLIEDITKWLCHYELVHKKSPALLWSYVFNYFIPRIGLEFNQSALEKAALRNFDVVKINFSPFRSCFTAERNLQIGIMEIIGEEYKMTPHLLNRNYRHFYGYMLLKNWENGLGNQTEITFDQVVEDLGYGKPFLWNEKVIMDVLELLQDEGILEINRQLSPITIIKQVPANYSLQKLYNYII